LEDPALEDNRAVGLYRVGARAQRHINGAIELRDNPPGRSTGRVVADEQCMAGYGRRVALGIGQDDLDVQDAERLNCAHTGDCQDQRREDDRAEHAAIVVRPSRDVNAVEPGIWL
jgi:hypothetical protein